MDISEHRNPAIKIPFAEIIDNILKVLKQDLVASKDEERLVKLQLIYGEQAGACRAHRFALCHYYVRTGCEEADYIVEVISDSVAALYDNDHVGIPDGAEGLKDILDDCLALYLLKALYIFGIRISIIGTGYGYDYVHVVPPHAFWLSNISMCFLIFS